MFYDVYVDLCKEVGKKPSAVAAELDINKSNVSNWKNNGYTPRSEALQQIADYFNVTTDYLLEKNGYRTCRDCGMYFDSWNESEREKHAKYHADWENRSKEFGFCWSNVKRERIKAEARKKIESENLTGDLAAEQYVLVLKALFSRSLESSGYAKNHPFFEDYASMLLNQESWKKETEQHGAYSILVDMFGVKDGIPKGSYYFSDYTKNKPTNESVDELIKDEPIAAYNNLKEFLTDADKSDIAQLIKLRAEINKSKL